MKKINGLRAVIIIVVLTAMFLLSSCGDYRPIDIDEDLDTVASYDYVDTVYLKYHFGNYGFLLFTDDSNCVDCYVTTFEDINGMSSDPKDDIESLETYSWFLDTSSYDTPYEKKLLVYGICTPEYKGKIQVNKHDVDYKDFTYNYNNTDVNLCFWYYVLPGGTDYAVTGSQADYTHKAYKN